MITPSAKADSFLGALIKASENELTRRIHLIELELGYLKEAQKRKMAGEPCPSLNAHVLQNIQAVAGGTCQESCLKYGIKLKMNGYQVGFCLACNAFIIAGYDGKRIKVISEDIAKDLSWS